MATDMIMKIEGVSGPIDGESIVAGHDNEIDVYSVSWGCSNPVTVGTSTGLSGGKVSISSLNITKKVDKASPNLFKACCAGEHLNKVTLVVRKTGNNQSLDFLTYTLEHGMVESWMNSGSNGSDEISESISIAFAKVKVEYRQQKMDGTGEAPVPAEWDQTVGV